MSIYLLIFNYQQSMANFIDMIYNICLNENKVSDALFLTLKGMLR